MRLPLDDIARLAGVKFTPVAGWQTRGAAFPRAPRCVVVHADVSRRTSGPKGALSSVVYGSATAPPPVAAFQLGRDGMVWLVASGVGNNAGTGNARKLGHPEWNTNAHTIGIEAANDNGLVKPAEPWPAVQMEAYRRLVVACHKWMAQQHALALSTQIRFTVGHKEWSTTGKSDPSFNMDTFRAQTRAVAFPPPPKETRVTALTPDERRDLTLALTRATQSINAIHGIPLDKPLEERDAPNSVGAPIVRQLQEIHGALGKFAELLEPLAARVAALESKNGAPTS